MNREIESLTITLTQEEKERIDMCANAEYLPASIWVKRLVLMECDKMDSGAKNHQSTNTPLDLVGYKLEELIERRDEYKKAPEGGRLCPACHAQVPNIKGQFYCSREHQAEFNNQLRRLKRANK